jgi:hypothetical protein
MTSIASRSSNVDSSPRNVPTIAVTSSSVTSLNARTESSDTLRSRFSGAWARRSQNASEMALAYSRHQIAEATAWEKVGRSADVVEPYPAPFPPLDA